MAGLGERLNGHGTGGQKVEAVERLSEVCQNCTPLPPVGEAALGAAPP